MNRPDGAGDRGPVSAELSIIIPALNAERSLPRCLDALIEGVLGGLVKELIVTDGGSTDDTLVIAEATGAEIVSGPASRGGQLRRGVAAARGRWILILHADTVLEAGWSEVVKAHIRDGSGPAHFRLGFDQRGPMPAWVAGWANFRSWAFSMPYGDQGLLVSRADYDRTGGYPDQPLMEDVALVRRLNRPLSALPLRAVTSARRYRAAGWLRRGARNLWTLGRYFAGADPEVLAAGYRR